MVNVSNNGGTPKKLAQTYKLNNLSGTHWEKTEKLNFIVNIINSGAFYHLTFEENLEVDRVITENTIILQKKVYGTTDRYRTHVKFKHDKLEELDANQVYYFIKDGLHFDRFLTKRGDLEAFRRVYNDLNNGLGVDVYKSDELHLQRVVILRAKVYGYFIGEELAYLLAVRSNELLLMGTSDGFTREYRDTLYSMYLNKCYIPYVNTLKDVNKISTRAITERDIFSEFEEGKVLNRGRITLKVRRRTLRERIARLIKENI